MENVQTKLENTLDNLENTVPPILSTTMECTLDHPGETLHNHMAKAHCKQYEIFRPVQVYGLT
jgi:hypothetical protein